MPRRTRALRWIAISAAIAAMCAGAWFAAARRPAGAPAGGAWLLAPTNGGAAVAFSPSGRQVQLRRCPPACPDGRVAAWALAGDGRTLAWIERTDDGETLHVRSTDDGGAAEWTAPLPETAPLPGERLPPLAPRLTWSPNHRAVLVLPLEGPPLVAWTDVHDVVNLEAPPAREVRAVAWSAGGADVGFVAASRDSGDERAGAVLIADAHTGRVRAQAVAVSPAAGLAWVGDRLVFAAYARLDWAAAPAQPRDPRLWSLALDGRLKAWTPLPPGWRPATLGGSASSSDPLLFAALVSDTAGPTPSADLWAFDPQRLEWRRLSKFRAGSRIVALAPAPDGRRAAFVVEQRGAGRAYRTMWVVAFPDAPRRLGANDGYGQPLWAPRLPAPWTTTSGWLPNA